VRSPDAEGRQRARKEEGMKAGGQDGAKTKA